MPKTIEEKLGLKPGRTALVTGKPAGLALDLPPCLKGAAPDLIVAFVASKGDLVKATAKAVSAYRRGAALWFAYPKKTGAIRTDISRDEGWEPLTGQDIHPVTQIALDETWSALRFRHRDEISSFTRWARK